MSTQEVLALVVPADGPATLRSVPTDLAGLRAAIGGGYLEGVSGFYGAPWHAYLDEEGRLKELPANPGATVLLGMLGSSVGMVVGDVIFLGNADGESGAEDEDADEGDVPDSVVNAAVHAGVLRHVCPRCGGGVPNDDDPGKYPGATSRKDNETEVCSRCGTEEALLGLARMDVWPEFPDRHVKEIKKV